MSKQTLWIKCEEQDRCWIRAASPSEIIEAARRLVIEADTKKSQNAFDKDFRNVQKVFEEDVPIYRQPKVRVYCQRCAWSGIRLDWWPARQLTEEKPCPKCDGKVATR